MYLLNVGHGECIYLKIMYNEKEFGIMVDGGSQNNSSDSHGNCIESKQAVIEFAKKNALHAIVVSHVDDDHIGGILNIIRDWKENKIQKNFYLIFNDYIDHCIAFSQAETLMDEIEKLKKQQGIEVRVINTYSKRYTNAGKWGKVNLDTLPIEFLSTFQRRLLKNKDKNKIYITLLTPGKEEINAVMGAWGEVKEKNKKKEGYDMIKNNASISFLLEYGGKTILFSGDSSVYLIKQKLLELDKKIEHIDYFNLCHHGAYQNNIGIQELLKKYECHNIFFSTNSVKYPEHPNLFLLYSLLKGDMQLKIFMSNPLRYEKENIEKCFEKNLENKNVECSEDLKKPEQMESFCKELANRIGTINLESNMKYPIHYQNLNELMNNVANELGLSKKRQSISKDEMILIKEYLEEVIINELKRDEESRFSVAKAGNNFPTITIEERHNGTAVE